MWVKEDAWLHVHVSREVEAPRGIHRGVEHAREHACLAGFTFQVVCFALVFSAAGFRGSGSGFSEQDLSLKKKNPRVGSTEVWSTPVNTPAIRIPFSEFRVSHIFFRR